MEKDKEDLRRFYEPEERKQFFIMMSDFGITVHNPLITVKIVDNFDPIPLLQSEKRYWEIIRKAIDRKTRILSIVKWIILVIAGLSLLTGSVILSVLQNLSTIASMLMGTVSYYVCAILYYKLDDWFGIDCMRGATYIKHRGKKHRYY